MFSHKVISFILVATLLPIAFVLAPFRPASVTATEDPGVIAYVRRSTNNIHLISPDGTGNRVLWTAPQTLPIDPAYDLAWRPDGRELAFSSQHEEACSWYQSDVYAVLYNGSGYRRVTNSPACAMLTSLPKGKVTVNVTNWTTDPVQVYVAGAPGIQTVLYDGTITFEDVADFGPGIAQPAVGIWGLYRIFASPPLADVQPDETVAGGNLIISQYSGIDWFGAGKISWNADGSVLAYGMRTYSDISQIPAVPPYGSIGEMLPVVKNAEPGLVAWGTTAATKNQYLYFSMDDPFDENVAGIYLNTVGNASGGTKLVPISAFYDAEVVFDIEWLPDASGFLFTKFYVNFEYYTDIFEYNFASHEITQLTSFPDDSAHGLSISPDGQQVVIERVVDDDSTSSLWIMNRDGTGLHKLADDAGRPAWGPTYVPQPVKAEFVGTPTSGINPLLVQFTNQSIGDYDTCTWTFGDGGTSSNCSNPTHTYATPGVYTVALTVSGPVGTDTLTRMDSITVYEPVQAVFTGSPTAGRPPLFATFTNQSTGDYNSCTWAFGDGESSSICSNPTHTYATEGVYTVALTVSGLGGTDTQTRAQYITVHDEYRAYLPLALRAP